MFAFPFSFNSTLAVGLPLSSPYALSFNKVRRGIMGSSGRTRRESELFQRLVVLGGYCPIRDQAGYLSICPTMGTFLGVAVLNSVGAHSIPVVADCHKSCFPCTVLSCMSVFHGPLL